MTVLPSLLVLGTQLLVPVSDTVPAFDVTISCKGVEAAKMAESQSYENCMNDENSARMELQQSWTSYPASERAQCSSEASMGGPPSYVDLLVCLKMSRDVDAANAIKLKGARKRR